SPLVRRFNPVFWDDDARVDTCMFLQQVQQVRAVEQLERLPEREIKRSLPVPAGRHQDALRSAFIHHCTEQVTHSAHTDRVLVTLRLDNDLAAKHRTMVESNSIDTTVTTRLSLFRVQPHRGEEVLDEGLELTR